MCAQSAIAAVDPELLASRVQAVDNPTTREWARSLSDAALAALVSVRGVNLASLQSRAGDSSPHELWARVNEAVAAMWLDLEELRQRMAPLVQAYEACHDDSLADNITPLEVPVAGAPPSDIDLDDDLLRRIAETAWAMAFVLAGEVEAFRRRLTQVLALEESWELAEAVEDHLGHVRAAVGAVLTGIYASLPRADDRPAADESVEVLTARELRARVFELRDAILGIERAMHASQSASWQPLLVEARERLERFMFGPGFAWMRATDKRTFLVQRRTLTEILAMYSPLRAEPARRTVENLARFLEAMEVLNQRESLIVHDRAALAGVVKHMERAKGGGAEAREHIAAALAALSDAQGRDRGLDALLGKSMALGSEVPVDDILARARAVLGQLGGSA